MNLFLTRLPLFPVWPEVVVVDDVTIPLRDSPLSPRARRRLMRGLYETEERSMVKEFIRSGDEVLELGASVGIVTCFLARAVGFKGRIVSVEADAALRPHFERQLSLNNARAQLVQGLCCPLWNQPVPPELASRKFRPAESHLSGRIGAGANETGTSVPWLTAELIAKQAALRPTALVVDIEGTEEVWADHAPQFPESVRVVIAEIHTKRLPIRRTGDIIGAILREGFALAGARDDVFSFERN